MAHQFSSGSWSWSNWAASATSRPTDVVLPRSDADVAALLARATAEGRRVKVVGAAHSFTDIAATDGTLVSLDAMQGLEHVEAATGEVTLRGGTRISAVAALLAPSGLALPNMGDIDRQSLAGALATATHGTGLAFTGFPGLVTRMRLALPDGSIVTCSATERPELFQAARVGLGAIGVVLAATLRCVPAFRLRAVEAPEPLEGMVESFVERSAANDHLEFYWFPHTGTALAKTNTRLAADAPLHPIGPLSRLVDDELLGNGAFSLMCAAGARLPAAIPPLNRFAAKTLAARDYTDESHRVFVTARRVRFREMEYSLPLEAFAEVFGELRSAIEGYREPISFPVEVRTSAADDTWMGTSSGRRSVYFAVHRYARQPHQEFLEHVERVFTAQGGRPHWGKLHSRDADYLVGAYPGFGRFTAVRDGIDPTGTLLNPYLRRVLGA
ncbi:D-arabinono-1,4-lactone oxidase [Arthrobacter sp.]|uniref:D-arabinono-1,4-lactone oxidase n=1 Tax=Arthrobacter sp. TaxID=1667 RepID=UPI003A8FDBCE